MVGLIDAKYKEWIVANGLTGTAAALINVAGSAEFQNTPKKAANITATYEWPLAMFGRDGGLALSNSLSYKSKVNQTEFVRPTGIAATDLLVPSNALLSQEAYSLWDASLIWTSKDRKVQVALNGRNLGDKRYKVAGYNFVSFFNTVTTFYGDPRIIKASITLKF
jgi:iron complex outermembrane receptor protein